MGAFERDEIAYAAKASEEPDIVRSARMFDDARNDLDNLRQQHRKINEAIKAAQERMNEAAVSIRSYIDMTALEAEAKRLR